jgi:ribosomal protein S18 acetylase RimI-like enzyme
MHSKVIIRPFRNSDEPQVVLIVRELQDHESQFYDRLKPSDEIGAWYVDWIRENRDSKDGHVLVAEIDGQVVGYAALDTMLDSTESREEIYYQYASISDLAVLKSHRNRGIGMALLAECERLARSAGRKWLRLGVHADNEGARRLYERFRLTQRFLILEKVLD